MNQRKSVRLWLTINNTQFTTLYLAAQNFAHLKELDIKKKNKMADIHLLCCRTSHLPEGSSGYS